MNDEGHQKVIPPEKPDAAEEQRVAARRRFLKRGSAAGSGLAIYTIYHQRSFAGGTAKKVIVSSPAACASLGGSEAKKTKVVDSVNPVQKTDKNGNPVYDKNGNPVYVATKDAFQCTVVK